jgi:sugar O-acyltransferase (sialic acid O-acetyltransferase NeuD family)
VSAIAIYGAGGFGRETLEMIYQMNRQGYTQWRPVGFFDDGLEKGKMVEGLPVLGGLSELNAITDPLAIVVTIADPLARQALCEKIKKQNRPFPSLIHPSANLGSKSNKIKDGAIVTAGVILTTNIFIGEFTIINLASTVGHDVIIGPYSTLMPACHISGKVQLGQRVFVGTGASILQNLSIGEDAIVGAGAVVTKSVNRGTTVIGVPAKEKVNV